MTETDSRELDCPAMSSKSVDAAAGTARAQLTYQHLAPADPGHPLPDGEFWGAFMRSLEGRWEQIKRDHAERTNTFDSDDADGQTRLVTDGGETPGRGIEQSQQLRRLRPDSNAEYPHYGCPSCGDWVAEWQDCPHCGWYDGDAWTAAVKRYDEGLKIAAADPIDLEAMR